MPDKSTATTETVSSEGLDAYKGYEYQIDVTVWLALRWMVEREFCASIEIEPASSEDIEAELDVPAVRAMVGVCANIAGGRVIVQVKSRGTGPWNSKAFQQVVAPSKSSKTSGAKKNRGPKPRARALEQLESDASAIYCFITNAQVDSSLSQHIVADPGQRSAAQQMPPHLRTGKWKGKGKEFTQRITICDQKIAHLIDLDTRRLLRESLQVPLAREVKCLTKLKEQVRNRLLGKQAGNWTSESIRKVARQHGGYPEEGKDLKSFVPPNNFSQIQKQLDQEHKLILIGPPGIGKTLAAEVLVFQHRTRKVPFEVLRGSLRPGDIRTRFREPGPVIVYLEDPWGKYKISTDVDLWVSELPKLLGFTGPEKRIVISSRRAILSEAMEDHIVKAVRTNMIDIRPNHYGVSEQRRILQGALDSAAPWQIDFADRHEERILKALSVPQSIHVFAAQLRKTSVEEQAHISSLLKEAATDAISSTFAREVGELNWSPGSAKGGAIALWAMLTIEDGLTNDRVAQVERKLRQATPHNPPELRKFVAWGKQAEWLRRRDNAIQAHPAVLEGMESLIERDKALAEDILEQLITIVTQSGDYSSAERLLLQFSQRELPVPNVVLRTVAEWLRSSALDASDETVIGLMTRFARVIRGTSDPVGMLCGALLGPTEKQPGFGYRPLPAWDETQREQVARSTEARDLCRRYILLGIPDDISRGFHIPRLLDFIQQLGWDFSSDLVAALEDGDTYIAREHLIRGGATCPFMPWNRVLDRLFALYDDVDARVKTREVQYRSAAQAEFDAAYCSRIDEEPQEEFFQIANAIEVYIDERRTRQGFAWLMRHPRLDELVYRWKEVLEQSPPSQDELEGLLQACSESSLEPVWRVIAELSPPEFRARALDALRGAKPDLLPAVLSTVEKLVSPHDFAGWLKGLGKSIGFARRALLVGAFISDRDLKTDSQHYAELMSAVECLDGSAALRALEACNTTREQHSDPLEADAELVRYLELLAQSDSLEISWQALLILSARLNRNVVHLATRCLDMGDDRIRRNVWKSIGYDPSDAARQLMFSRGLSDPDYRGRRIAMGFLAPSASAEERAAIMIAGAHDKSAPIREFVAQTVGQFRWSEGLAVLEELLQDDRNKSESWGDGSENHHVARAAARAFGQFETLPDGTLERLAKFLLSAANGNRDIVVHYELIKSLGSHDHDSVNTLLYRGLRSRRHMRGHEQAGYPLRYAAGWGLIEQFEKFPARRNTADLEALREAALHDDERLVAPALIALGFAGAYQTQTLDSILTDSSFRVECKELVWLAAIAAKDDQELYEHISGFDLGFDALSSFHRLVVTTTDWSDVRIESYRSASVPLDTWLSCLETGGGEFGPHRRLLVRMATDDHIFPNADYQALRSHDLATQVPLITLRSMSGGE